MLWAWQQAGMFSTETVFELTFWVQPQEWKSTDGRNFWNLDALWHVLQIYPVENDSNLFY